MQDKEILINNWLLKSEEALDNARKSTEFDMLSPAQNRLYYAIFYAVMALAQKNGFLTSKHNQLRGWFNRKYIKTNKVDTEYGKLYTTCFDNRQKSDYTVIFQPDKSNLLNDIKKTQEFIDIIKELISKSNENL